MLHKRFIFRQLTRSGGQPVLFIGCIVLSIVSLIALDGFRNGIHESLLQDVNRLHAADIIVQSHFPLSPQILAGIKALEDRGETRSTPVYEFYSMVRAADHAQTLLADVKVVGEGYPFYGSVSLASGAAFQKILRPGGVVVGQGLLDRLRIGVGDRLIIGDRSLVVLDVVLWEPDRPVSVFSFGPRVFVSLDDADSLQLMKPGSRVSYKRLLKVKEGNDPDRLVKTLKTAGFDDRESVETARSAPSRIRKFFDNFFFFLTLIALFTLLLSGVGIRSTLLAFLHDKADTIAIARAVGADDHTIMTNFIALVLLMATIGTLLGIGCGLGLQRLLDHFFGALLTTTTTMPLSGTLSGSALWKGGLIGVMVTTLIAIGPLERLKEIRPCRVFQKEPIPPSRGPGQLLAGGGLLCLFAGLILWELKDIDSGMRFIGLLAGLILFAGLTGRVLLFLLKRLRPRALVFRQAIQGLFKPGSAPLSIAVTLSVSLGLVFSLYLVEKNLDSAFIRAYPEDAPNLFFIDIQPDQADAFSSALGIPAVLHPVIRGRLVSVNDQQIRPSEEKPQRGDSLSRPFNLTYRDHLLEDEILLKGQSLFQPGASGLQVSVLDTVTEMKEMRIGDRLAFNIQGIPVEATVSSIRSRTRESISPYFYFVFPDDAVLRKAPRTFFSAVCVPKGAVSALQYRMVDRFPNVSVLDVTQTLAAFAEIAHRLGIIVRLLTVFCIGAGILLIISSVLATRWDRIREAAYVKILGADSGFVLRGCLIEHLLIGGISALPALAISQISSYLVCRYRFAISYHPYLTESLCLAAGTLLLVTGVGLIASIPVIQQKPIAFLRNETGG